MHAPGHNGHVTVRRRTARWCDDRAKSRGRVLHLLEERAVRLLHALPNSGLDHAAQQGVGDEGDEREAAEVHLSFAVPLAENVEGLRAEHPSPGEARHLPRRLQGDHLLIVRPARDEAQLLVVRLRPRRRLYLACEVTSPAPVLPPGERRGTIRRRRRRHLRGLVQRGERVLRNLWSAKLLASRGRGGRGAGVSVRVGVDVLAASARTEGAIFCGVGVDAATPAADVEAAVHVDVPYALVVALEHVAVRPKHCSEQFQGREARNARDLRGDASVQAGPPGMHVRQR
mmetsp:Transcript_47131/g.131520  ORF Transcript_47131/g.131520 Transcript_47131/m.131520 type:complete len:286 (-) Transcript_47131:586-1443(-)